ncbi:MAG TPA: Erv1/Alr family FAD-linked sulfhydryl oxidase [Elusimicrobiota bacterium]|nr:Erv1/Alr family FAD-linked sulfhydryl oxidase [Elusimicrobiota bacterium]
MTRVETPREWGPRHWNRIHVATIRFPATPSLADEVKVRSRIVQFVTELPCPECRKDAVGYITQNPPATRNTHALQIWGWRFHNAVNARLGKPAFPFDRYCQVYADERAQADAKTGGGWRPRPRPAAGRPHRSRPRLP